MRNKLLMFLLAIHLIGCNTETDKKIVEDTSVELTREHSLKNLVEIKLNLYTIDNKLHPLIDSIIDMVCKCPENSNQQIGFVIYPYNSNVAKGFNISNIVDLNFQYYFGYDGVFYYRGYQFLTLGNHNGIIKIPNQNVILYSISNKVYPYTYHDYSATSIWTYVNENDDYKCISITKCGVVLKSSN